MLLLAIATGPAALAALAALAAVLHAAAAAATLPVQRHVGRWNATPADVPGTGNVVGGPLLGNGDAGVVFTSSGPDTLDLFLGKNDFWSDAVDGRWGWNYMHLAAGHLQVSAMASPPPPGPPGPPTAAMCLRAQSGLATAAAATWKAMDGPSSDGGCASDADCTPEGLLLTDTFFGTADGSFSVDLLPFAEYEVVVYFRMNPEHSFNISAGACTTGRVPTTVRPAGFGNASSFFSRPYPSTSNYLRLSGCAGPNLTVSFTDGGQQSNHRKSLAALQIIEVGVPNSRSIGLNIVGKTSKGKTGPIAIPASVRAGVLPRANWVNLRAPGCGGGGPGPGPVGFFASQHLFEARVDAAAGRLVMSSVMQANENTLISRLTCAPAAACAAGGQPVRLSLSSSDVWKLPKSADANSKQLWLKHENNFADANPMALGTCNPDAVFVRGVSRFVVLSGRLTVHNGTQNECPMLLPTGDRTPRTLGTGHHGHQTPWATDMTARVVVRGPCSEAAAQWALRAAHTRGHYTVQSVHVPGLCLGPSTTKDQLVYAVDCGKAVGAWITDVDDPMGGIPFSLQLVSGNGRSSECLISTAGNTNNTLAIVSEVRVDGKPLALDQLKSDQKLEASGVFTMHPGHSYEIVTALVTRRDLEQPGQYRYSRDRIAGDVVVAAGRAAASADTAALLVEHAQWWQQFWNKSSVDLGLKRRSIEGWW